MPGIFPEWLNVNAGRAYPLGEDSSRKDTSGNVKLPDSLIVDARISVVEAYLTGQFYVSRVGAFPDSVVIVVSYLPEDDDAREIATITVKTADHVPNTAYSFSGNGDDSSVLGMLTVGNLEEALRQVPGFVEFGVADAPFEPHVLFVSLPALQSVQLYTGNNLVFTATRILKLREGENCRLSYVGDDTIRIDLIPGENFTAPGDCENAQPLPPCIRTINGQAPDEDGNFNIDGAECIEVDTVPGTVSLIDRCAKSCCGCTELEALVSSLQSVEAQLEAAKSGSQTVINQLSKMLADLVSNM